MTTRLFGEATQSVPKVQQGISMVEMLVALGLGAFLMLGLTQVYMTNQQTSILQDDFARVQESGRIGAEMLIKEIRMADFNGCVPSTADIASHLDTADPDFDPDGMDFLAGGVSGANDVTTISFNGGATVITTVPNSDTLILRGMTDACEGLGRMTGTNNAASFFLSSANCPIGEGDILILANCAGGDMFSVSNYNTANVTVVHNTGNITEVGAVDNATSSFSRIYEAGASILRPYQKTFYIAPGVDGNSLFLRESADNFSQELVTNVTNFQVFYGEDSNGDGSVDRYRDADNVGDFNDVLSVRIELTVGSGEVEKIFRAVGNIRNRVNS